MEKMRLKRKRFAIFWSFLGAVVSLCICVILDAALQLPIRASQGSSTSENAPVPKGKEAVDVVATIVAMSQNPWQNTGYPFEILLLRVDKVPGDARIGPYARADFPRISDFTDSKETRVYRELLSSLRERKTWKILLRATNGPVLCAWRIPPPPIPGDFTTAGNPVIIAIGGASGYPDINAVPCYVFDQRDIEEVVSPDKPK
jgi:hypothetical protein